MTKKWSFHNALAGTRYVTSLFRLFWNVLPIGCFVTVVQFKKAKFWCSESPQKMQLCNPDWKLVMVHFWAFQNGCLFGVMKLPFYYRSETVKKATFWNKHWLETWLFIAFYNGCLLVVIELVFYGRYGTLKKSALRNEFICFFAIFCHYKKS